jgi:hypothetical protein
MMALLGSGSLAIKMKSNIFAPAYHATSPMKNENNMKSRITRKLARSPIQRTQIFLKPPLP